MFKINKCLNSKIVSLIKEVTIILSFLIFYPIMGFGQSMFSKKQLEKDVEYFFTTIKSNHVDPNFYSSGIDSIKDRILISIPDSMNLMDFHHYMVLQTNNLWDMHTGFSSHFFYNKLSDTSSLIPGVYEITDDKVFLIKSDSRLEISKINNYPIDLIIKSFNKYCKADMSVHVRIRFIEKNFALLYNAEFGESPHFTISFNKNGTKTMTLQAINYKQWEKPFKADGHFTARYYPNDSFAYLIINTFNGEKSNELDVFLANSMKTIDSLLIKNLIIDTRFNGGGSDDCVRILLDYIFAGNYSILYGFSKHKDQNGQIQTGDYIWHRSANKEYTFKGKVLVLQSTETASAAMDFSSAIKTSRRGLIIGEPTADPVYSFASAKDYSLPNTKLAFRCASGFYAMPGTHNDVNFGVIPDIPYKFANVNIETDEIKSILNIARDYYKGYFIMDYFK